MDVATANAPAARLQNDEHGIRVQNQFAEFLESYTDESGTNVYFEQLKLMFRSDTTTVYVEFSHLVSFSNALAVDIENEYYRFDPFLKRAVRSVISSKINTEASIEVAQQYWVAFYGMQNIEKIRDLKTNKLGHLVTIRGTVVRTSEVRPELVMGTFRCMDCGRVLEKVEQQFKYTEPTICPVPNCENRKRFFLLVDKSEFVDWQKLRAQEGSSEIPSGGMPRSIEIILRHEAVEKAKPGDKCLFTGTLIVIPDVAQLSSSGGRVEAVSSSGTRARDGYAADGVSGLRALGVRDLNYKLAFLATTVQSADSQGGAIDIREDSTTENLINELPEDESRQFASMKEDPDLYQKMVNSIAPSVFGHEEIKRGILLMLFGGVHKSTPEGMRLRGDINVCIVGDPGTAKSQFLKYVVEFLPRAVYTSGKASSAAGLTVSVVKDEETKEFCIEAGALMLADNGICCIDEFDKMEIKDQVAIHEAMEQQTISIAKAGIQATLNARTSVLAAANPVNGRYDKSRSLKANVAMTPAIMSRFDLFFVVLDECNDVTDYNIARHIVSVHQLKDEALTPPYTTEQLQRYIKVARTIKPMFTPHSQKLISELYRRLRQNDVGGASQSSYRITVRQLESMIRLSEALARLHCDMYIQPKHVKEAYRLLKTSIIHVESADVTLEDDEEFPADSAAAKRNGRRRGDDEDDDDAEDYDDINGDGGDDDDDDDDGNNNDDNANRMDVNGSTNGTSKRNGTAGGRHTRRVTRAQETEPSAGATAAVASSAAIGEDQTKKATALVSYEKYMRITRMLVTRLRQNEQVEENGVRQADLINWYLQQIEEDIHTVDELESERELIKRVVQRLIRKDSVLIEIYPQDEEEDGAEQSEQDREENRFIVAHPNYVLP